MCILYGKNLFMLYGLVQCVQHCFFFFFTFYPLQQFFFLDFKSFFCSFCPYIFVFPFQKEIFIYRINIHHTHPTPPRKKWLLPNNYVAEQIVRPRFWQQKRGPVRVDHSIQSQVLVDKISLYDIPMAGTPKRLHNICTCKHLGILNFIIMDPLIKTRVTARILSVHDDDLAGKM